MTASTPFGSWRSPLSAEAIAADVNGLQELRAHGEVLYWLESRPAEQGRTVLMARAADGACTELTPSPYNVRSRVHEYGGGAYLPCATGVFFVNYADQRIYRILQTEEGDAIEPVSDPDPDRRFADLCWDANRSRLILVTEHHRPDGEPINSLQSLSFGDGAPVLTTLHEGHDFYAAPRISPNGENLAFVCWDHPNMPWDGSQLIRADITATGELAASPLDRVNPDGTVTRRNLGEKNNEVNLLDLRLSKDIKIGNWTAQPILDIFNVFNESNFLVPQVTALSFNFDGTLRSGAGDPREIQLGVRFLW